MDDRDTAPDDSTATPGDARPGPDLLTIGLLVFFIALIGIVAVLLLLPLLTGSPGS